jgi:hypothetical protein
MLRSRREHTRQKRWKLMTTLQHERRTIVLGRSAALLPRVHPPSRISKHQGKIVDTKKTMLVALLAARNKDNKPASEATDTIAETITIAGMAPVVMEEEPVRKVASIQTTREDNSRAGAEDSTTYSHSSSIKESKPAVCACIPMRPRVGKIATPNHHVHGTSTALYFSGSM